MLDPTTKFNRERYPLAKVERENVTLPPEHAIFAAFREGYSSALGAIKVKKVFLQLFQSKEAERKLTQGLTPSLVARYLAKASAAYYDYSPEEMTKRKEFSVLELVHLKKVVNALFKENETFAYRVIRILEEWANVKKKI
jgi:hypothetical protein